MWSQGRALETMKSNQRRRFNEGSFWPKRLSGRGPIFRQRSRAAIIQSSVTSATMNESEDCGDGCAESGAAVACCCSGGWQSPLCGLEGFPPMVTILPPPAVEHFL
jgi:hypothetical protein